jgi:hypothetical protein
MRQPNPGELNFAKRLFATELKPRRRHASALWPHVFDLAVLTSFLFFLLM